MYFFFFFTSSRCEIGFAAVRDAPCVDKRVPGEVGRARGSEEPEAHQSPVHQLPGPEPVDTQGIELLQKKKFHIKKSYIRMEKRLEEKGGEKKRKK